jgi:hypothetical protein
LKVSAYLPSFHKRSQGEVGFKKLSSEDDLFLEFLLVAVLFPTFALQYHVPFRNETEQWGGACLQGFAQAARLYFIARGFDDSKLSVRRHVVCSVAVGATNLR